MPLGFASAPAAVAQSSPACAKLRRCGRRTRWRRRPAGNRDRRNARADGGEYIRLQPAQHVVRIALAARRLPMLPPQPRRGREGVFGGQMPRHLVGLAACHRVRAVGQQLPGFCHRITGLRQGHVRVRAEGHDLFFAVHQYFQRHSFDPVGATSRYSPLPSASLSGRAPGFAALTTIGERHAASRTGALGWIPPSVCADATNNTPSKLWLAMPYFGPHKTKKPRRIGAFRGLGGLDWTTENALLAEGAGFEPAEGY
jgi:hypothetical protein